ncbi:Mobile element protein [Methanosarcina barkeri str. Wiesmoor]|uniref:Mobile element protein n=2 Tax=Methanosarcina barkeri TaxID=2208 RepID=A0A0E3QPX3_METBA|nr:IS1634-like element ISMba13 family transposase [Methanosarcina barkeri]AKB52249.1 Mobile element protein [Methanosarcina barkeri str. Wiesmoor]
MLVTTRSLDHHGIVSGIYDELEIGKVIDEVLPKFGQHKLAHSIVVKAMILNCLGFVDSRLYMYSQYFETLPVERLLGPEISASDLTDDVLGRTLDAIYEADPTQLFMKLSLKMLEIVNIRTQLLQSDTTNFSLHGDYNYINDGSVIEITYGHAKDGRDDLKRFGLGMITNQYGIPLFAKAYSGNASDKETIIEAMKILQENITFPDDVYYIADSALYSEGNIKAMIEGMKWITRVPSTLNLAKNLLISDLEFKNGEDPRYSFYETIVEYGGIKQKWVVVYSTEMQKRKDITFERKIQKKVNESQKDLKDLKKIKFACEKDAIAALERWKKENPHCLLETVEISTVSTKENGKIGRPKKNEKPIIHYVVNAKAVRNYEIELNEKEYQGRFIIASNDLNLDAEKMLEYYKNQSKVEKGFRFIKDKSFRVSEVYLKKPQRIEALSMIMVLTLMVYSVAEWQLREKLKETGETIPNQVKKQTQKPTLKWAFVLMRGITEVKVEVDSKVITKIANMDEIKSKIIRLMGKNCEKYYF